MLVVVTRSKLVAHVTRVSLLKNTEFRRRKTVSSDSQRPPSSLQMELSQVVKALETLSPVKLAETWDNVGLLVEPSSPHVVSRLLLTNDLTEEVLDEAIEQKANFVLSYHPPLFNAVKRLTANNWKERCIVRCLERRIAVYSPHTSWDGFTGGINDWLAGAFQTETVQPITPYLQNPQFSHQVSLDVSPNLECHADILEGIVQTITSSGTNHQLHLNCRDPEGSHKLAFSCNELTLCRVVQLLQDSPLLQLLRITKLEKVPLSQTGTGRLCTLQQPLSVSEVVEMIKGHLNLSHLRLAMARGKDMKERGVTKVAICAGSGSSVLRNVAADVYWTGEMSHHDVLDAVHRGTSVVLCEHSNTERGFLKHFAPKINQALEHKVDVIISAKDKDPLIVI